MGASLGSGGSGGGRRARRRRHAPMAEINITPMVDVMLVLLIIFMVAAPLLTAGVPLDLPQSKAKAAATPKEKPIQVSITRDGRIFLGEEEKADITLADLGRKLKDIAAARGGTDEPIFVRADRQSQHEMFLRVMAEISGAGFRKLSIRSEMESGG